MGKRKRICPKCGRNLWRKRDYYSDSTPYCKDCSRALKNAEYARNRKVPDGIRYDSRTGRCVEHRGQSTKIFWSGAMTEKLRRLFPATKTGDIAIEMGLSERTIIRKARELGLEKDPRWLKQNRLQNCKTMAFLNKYVGNPGQFKKGERRSRATEYKPRQQRQ